VKTLHLLRHAKSSWANAGLDDHERPLDPRGARAATLMGICLAQEGVRPGLVLCSSARRTRETAERVLAELPAKPPVVVERDLYLAAPSALCERVQSLDAALESVLVVGHNPGLHELAVWLAGSGDPQGLRRLRAKLPTGAWVELRFEGSAWNCVEPGRGELGRFVAPKDLV